MKLAMLVLSLLGVGFLAGCSSQGGSGGFDIVVFLKNPAVMIIIALVIVWWMWKKK